jgi:hypothetical protein
MTARIMIGFGELRRASTAWGVEIGTAEAYYALSWALYGLAMHAGTADVLALDGASALAHAYFENYPQSKELALLYGGALSEQALAAEIQSALDVPGAASGPSMRLDSFKPTEARIEFTGPLGRRSAAQPQLVVQLSSRTPRLAPAAVPLIRRFSDSRPAEMRAVRLEEIAAALLGRFFRSPRARDIYDLWFILAFGEALARGEAHFDGSTARELAGQVGTRGREGQINGSKKTLDPAYASILEKNWENALSGVRPRPTFREAVALIEAWVGDKS